MSLFEELKRRNVFRVAIAYGVIAWVLAQIADLAFDNFGAPDWVSKSVLFVLILGLPLAVFFAWAFELTPEGIKKERDVDRNESITSTTGKKLNRLIIAVLVVAVGFLLYERSGTDQPAPGEEIVTTDSSKMSIAVLPFDNRSNRDEDEFFTDGIHDDLLTTMANIGSMKVISRTSVMEYKDTTKKIPEIAKELGVANILEGGIQRSGNQVRINVQLIDAETDEHLWAEIYDRQLTAENLFRIQSEVSQAIANALHATLSPEETQRISAVPTNNIEAYETYLLGRQRWKARTADSTAQAVELFLRAIELDPDYAEAWAGLGDAYRHQVPYGGLPGREVFPKAEKAILKALELNPDLAEANAAYGGLLAQTNKDLSLQYLRRALELNPSYSPAYNWLGVYFNRAARYDEAAEILSRGLDVDPLSAVMAHNLAHAAGATGHFDLWKSRIDRNLELHSDSPFTYGSMGAYYVFAQGQLDEAVPWFLRSVSLDPNDTTYRVLMGYLFAELGHDATADRWVNSALQLQPENLEARVAQVLNLASRGQIDEATAIAHRSWEDSEKSRQDEYVLALLSSADLADGRPDLALRRYAEEYPDLTGFAPDSLNILNAGIAIDIVRLARETGDHDLADSLLKELTAVLEAAPVIGLAGSAGYLSSAYMLAGKPDDALVALRTAVDAGWRAGWRYILDYHWSLEPLRDNPKFQSMRMELAADMEKQLKNIRRMEASGELPVVPGMEPLGQPEKAGPPPT